MSGRDRLVDLMVAHSKAELAGLAASEYDRAERLICRADRAASLVAGMRDMWGNEDAEIDAALVEVLRALRGQ